MAGQAEQVRAACAAAGLTLHSTFTGLAAYSSNLLLHPDPAARERARAWYRRVIDFTAAAGAGSTGGHIGAYSVRRLARPGHPAGAVGRAHRIARRARRLRPRTGGFPR